MARPPRVIVFTESPKSSKTIAVTRKDSGMAVSVMAVMRRFARKSSRMTVTRMLPYLSLPLTPAIETSMKSDCLKISGFTSTPFGSVRWISAMAASTRSVSATVSVPGCFWIDITTAGLAMKEPSPRLVRGPIFTSATSLMRIERPR